MEYPLTIFPLDLTTPPAPGSKVQIFGPGKGFSDVFLNSPNVPAGTNLRLIYGNNPDGLVFGPGGLLNHTDICPRPDQGLFALWDVGAPGTIVKIAVAFASGSQGAGA